MGEFDAGRSRPAKDDLRSGMIGLIAEMKEPVRILSLPGRNWRLERGLLRAGVLFESSAFEKRSGTYWECVEGAPGQLVGTGKGYTEWRSGRPGRWSRLRLQKKDIFTALELGGLDTDVSWFDLCGPVLPDWIPLIQSQKAKTRSLFALTFLKGRNWGMAAHEVKYAGGYREWTRASFGEPTQWVEYHDTSPMVLAVWAKGQGTRVRTRVPTRPGDRGVVHETFMALDGSRSTLCGRPVHVVQEARRRSGRTSALLVSVVDLPTTCLRCLTPRRRPMTKLGELRPLQPTPADLRKAKTGGGCAFRGCTNRHASKGLCFRHYMQRRRRGMLSPITTKARVSLEERFWSKVRKGGPTIAGCGPALASQPGMGRSWSVGVRMAPTGCRGSFTEGS